MVTAERSDSMTATQWAPLHGLAVPLFIAVGGSLFGYSSVCVAPVADTLNGYNLARLVDRVNNPIVSNSNPVSVLCSGQLPHPDRPGLLAKCIDRLNQLWSTCRLRRDNSRSAEPRNSTR